MPRFVALLRAVNVGGTGKLPMRDLVALCETAGFEAVRTHIASGNAVFCAVGPEGRVKTALERQLEGHIGKPVPVFVREAGEFARILAANPFRDRDPGKTATVFLDHAPPPDALDRASGVAGELFALGNREIYVFYPDGMGRSKLRIPAAESGTARNLNTLTKLVEMARSGN